MQTRETAPPGKIHTDTPLRLDSCVSHVNESDVCIVYMHCIGSIQTMESSLGPFAGVITSGVSLILTILYSTLNTKIGVLVLFLLASP